MDSHHATKKKNNKHNGEWIEAFFFELICGSYVMVSDAREEEGNAIDTIRRVSNGPFSFQPNSECMPKRACVPLSQLTIQAKEVTPNGSDTIAWSMLLSHLPTNFIEETTKTLVKMKELHKILPREIAALVDCARHFFEFSDVMVSLVPANVRAAIQNFQGDDNDADSNVRALFNNRRFYDDSLRYIKDLLIFLWLEDPGKLNPYVKWVNSPEFSVEKAYSTGLIASLLFDVATEVGEFAVATTVINHAAQYCFSLKEDGRGANTIEAISHEAASRKFSTALHTVRLGCIAKCILCGNRGGNMKALATDFNACKNIQDLSVFIKRFRSAASLVARPREVSVNVAGTHIINGLEFHRKDIEQVIPRMLAKFYEIFRKCLDCELVCFII